MGSYKQSALVTGGQNNKTEIFDFDSKQWKEGPDYPFNDGNK